MIAQLIDELKSYINSPHSYGDEEKFNLFVDVLASIHTEWLNSTANPFWITQSLNKLLNAIPLWDQRGNRLCLFEVMCSSEESRFFETAFIWTDLATEMKEQKEIVEYCVQNVLQLRDEADANALGIFRLFAQENLVSPCEPVWTGCQTIRPLESAILGLKPKTAQYIADHFDRSPVDANKLVRLARKISDDQKTLDEVVRLCEAVNAMLQISTR